MAVTCKPANHEDLQAAPNGNALSQPLKLKCGATIPNRICKPATSEHMSTRRFDPSSELCTLYARWSDGGAGLIITGNIMIDRQFREGTRNCVLDEDSNMYSYKKFAQAAKQRPGCIALAQISHPGRQCPTSVTYAQPVAPSACNFRIPAVGIQLFRTPRAASLDEIANLVKAYASTAKLAVSAGFDGVQVHGAHGYLISQFLSPRTNLREDKYGGSGENRRRFLLEVIEAVRREIGSDKILSVKINSQDFSEGGFSEGESADVVAAIAPLVDLIEISGGTYEDAKFMHQDKEANSLFCAFAARVRERLRDCDVPLMVTGGFREWELSSAAVEKGSVDMVGVCRPLCMDPALPKKWLSNLDNPSSVVRFSIPIFPSLLVPGLAYMFHQEQLERLGDGKNTTTKLSYTRILSTQIVRLYIWDWFTRPQPLYVAAALVVAWVCSKLFM